MQTRTMACAIAIAACSAANAQDWNTLGNFISLPNQYLGCDVFSTQPLRLSTLNNQPIHFTTSNLLRAQINERVTYPVLGGFTNVIADGYTLITGEADAITNVNSRAPFSRLHLVDDVGATDPNVYAQEYGFRNWMRNGITFTGKPVPC